VRAWRGVPLLLIVAAHLRRVPGDWCWKRHLPSCTSALRRLFLCSNLFLVSCLHAKSSRCDRCGASIDGNDVRRNVFRLLFETLYKNANEWQMEVCTEAVTYLVD
jgi:hypothetical protein